MQVTSIFALVVGCLVCTLVLAEPFSKHHYDVSSSSSGSSSGSSSSGSSGSGYHYAKPKKPFYLPAASHTKVKIIKYHGYKKKPSSSYGAPTSSGSGSSSSGSSSGSSGPSGHSHYHKPAVKVIIKKHGKAFHHHG
ncbi:uncharacterized protein LOC135941453 [Cloeon dipterum]|uniref:uncharacterized protein LOC135941453 n=1 Tax=Cloeon dipterum TaxID=197152 RepID=UPI00321FA7DB